MIASVDALPLQFNFLVPTKFIQTAVKQRMIIAAVQRRHALERRHGSQRIGHLIGWHKIAPPHRERVEIEILCHEIDQPFTYEIRLEATGPAIGSGRRFVRRQRIAG